MKRITLSTLVLLLLSYTVKSQSISLDGIAGKRFEGVHSIVSPEDGVSAGYYTYYQTDRGKKGMRTYEFVFMDPDLKEKNVTTLEVHKNIKLNHTIFNGKYLLISYLDWKNKVNVFKLLNTKGKIIKTKEEAIDKKTFRNFSVYPADEGQGFYFITALKVKKAGIGYEIQKLDNDLNEIWISSEKADKGVKSIADLVNTNGKLVLWQENNVKGKIKPSVVCLDGKTGKKIYERDGYDGESTILNNQIRIDEAGNVYLGGAYVNKERVDYINNDGVYILKLDPNGNELLYSKVGNKEKIQPILKAASKGVTLGSKDKIFVQDLLVVDGEIVVVTEMFRKNVNVTPATVQATRDLITGKAIGYIGGYNDDKSKFVFEIMDYMLFRFNDTGDLSDIQQVTKDAYNKITVWTPYSGYGGVTLAKIMSQKGWFDYSFTVENSAGEKVMVCKNNAKPRKPQVYTYSVDKSYAQKKIDLKQESKIDLEKGKVGYFKAMRSSKGKIAVAYFQRKLKKITINQESID